MRTETTHVVKIVGTGEKPRPLTEEQESVIKSLRQKLNRVGLRFHVDRSGEWNPWRFELVDEVGNTVAYTDDFALVETWETISE